MYDRAICPEKCAVPKQTRAHASIIHVTVTSRVCKKKTKKKTSMDASSTLQHNVAYSVTLASVDADGWCDKPAQIHAFGR